MKVILAPHLDDEVLGCYSIIDQVDRILYFTADYRVEAVKDDQRYICWKDWNANKLQAQDTIYIPSHYDYHPLHKQVRRIGLSLPCKREYYSVEMNVPWLEEEENPRAKRALFERMYPDEDMRSDKYFLFCSIKPFDEVIWASVRYVFEGYHCWPDAPDEVAFLRNEHRHLFHVQADVQQFEGDRDLEYFILQRRVKGMLHQIRNDWQVRLSCEEVARELKRWLEVAFPDRCVRVSVFEDGENGCVVE